MIHVYLYCGKMRDTENWAVGVVVNQNSVKNTERHDYPRVIFSYTNVQLWVQKN